MSETYEAPKATTVGSVHDLTLQFDKIGSASDIFTPTIPDLDGEVVFDPD